jgi:phage major head subunit gpT-like protein
MELIKKLFNLQLFATPVQPTETNTIDYTAADRDDGTNFGKLLEPGLRKIFFETYDEIPEQYSKIYNVLDSTKAQEHDWGMGAFGDWTKRVSQFDTVAYKTLSPGLDRTYTHEAFTQGFMVAREMYDDDQYRQIEKMPKAMARSGRAKVEKDAMELLIHGFVTNGHGVAGDTAIYDAKALFASDHPLLDNATAVGKNLATGVLSDANLKSALKLMRETLDEAGNLVQFKATKLIIPPALEDTAIRLLQSAQVVGSDYNDTNKFLNGYGIEIVVMDYLSASAGGSDTHWFLQDGSRHEMNFFWRVKPEFKWEEDFDTFVAKYRGYMRYSYGVSDWRGIVGSTGIAG